jgi:hypothetical protein
MGEIHYLPGIGSARAESRRRREALAFETNDRPVKEQ